MDSEPTWIGGYFGLPWFTHDQYHVVRRAVLDPQNMPPDYKAWLEFAEKIEQGHQRRGVTTVRVHVDLDAFRAWLEGPHSYVGWPERRARMDTAGYAVYAQFVSMRWAK